METIPNIFDKRLPWVPPGWNDRLHFFKYMTASTAKIVLKNRTLRWSAPSRLNDPFDIQFNMNIEANPDRLREAALELLWRVHDGQLNVHPDNPLGAVINLLRLSGIKLGKEELLKEFGPAFDEGFERMLAVLPQVHKESAALTEDIKILCLTIRPDNNLMWSHYADSHQGVVLRFRSIPALGAPYGMAKPVNYVDQVPPLLNEEQLAGIFAGSYSIREAGIFDRTVYTKSKVWAYEEEWRLHAGAGRSPGTEFEDCPFGLNELDGIVFGLKTSDAHREDLKSLAAVYPNVELMQTRRSPASYELSITEAS